MTEPDWKATFTGEFAKPPSTVSARIHAEVYGDEYPANLDTYSFVTVTDLRRIAAESRLEPGGLLVDVGCGYGGPGLWVAAQREATLVGLDIADTALSAASRRATERGQRAQFALGSFASTGLATASADAVMSVDALMFAPDKAEALTELARILKPGGRLLVTTWDFHEQPEQRPPQVPDHRPLLDVAGFTVRAYEDTPRWREYQERLLDLSVEHVDELAAEHGEDPAESLTHLAMLRRNLARMTRRLLIVADRR